MTALSQKGSLFVKFETFLIEERRVSRKTLRNYRSDLNNFLKWCRHFSSESPLSFLTASIVTSYKESQTENRVPIATINRRLSTLRNFGEFLVFEGLLDQNPLETVGNVKGISVTGNQKSDTQNYRHTDYPITRLPDPPTPPPPPRMPKELTTPYRVKGPESLFLHRVKITTAAISGFMSVFVLLFIIKGIFGDALIFGPGATNTEDQEVTTLSFGDLLAQTPTVLGVSTQKAPVLSQSTAHGSATLSAGGREIALYSPNLTMSSRITVIPENSIESAIFVAKTSGDYFTVAVDRPSPSDIPFEWEIR